MDIFHERAGVELPRPVFSSTLPPPPPQAAALVAVEEGLPSKLRVVVFNVGLLRVKVPFVGTVFSNPPCVDQRFPFLAGALNASGADVLCLQEIYEEVHVKALVAQTCNVYPYCARVDSGFAFQKHNGLMYLSKFPIECTHLSFHEKAANLEVFFGSKACLACVVVHPTFGRIAMVNMHTTAGGLEHPEKVDQIREAELKEAIDLCEEYVKKDLCDEAMIVGDLNCGPEASSVNYGFMIENLWSDAVQAAWGERSPIPPTWDSRNLLNVGGVHAMCPSQRVDHVFQRKGSKLKPESACLMFTEKIVEVLFPAGWLWGKAKPPVHHSLSDHSGVMVTFGKR